MSLRIPMALSIALLLFCAASPAQLTRGFVSGTVQDSSGGLIGGVKILITNLDTGIARDIPPIRWGYTVLSEWSPAPTARNFQK